MLSGSPAPPPRRRRWATAGLAAALAVSLLGACDNSTPKLDLRTAKPAPPAGGFQPVPPPTVVTVDPPNGATDVDPRRATLAVTFDRPMDPEGWAWVIEHPTTAPDLGAATWDAEHRTHTTEVRLEPGRSYVVWLNSPQYSYFRDRQGVAATPFRWTFATRAASPSGAAGIAPLAAHGAAAPPHVVALDPPNGATDVDPAKTFLRATFDRPMEASWSWVTEGSGTFPESTGQPAFESDRKTAVLPVRLAPGRTYVVWLNSEQYRQFRDAHGLPAPPLRWTFTTRVQR